METVRLAPGNYLFRQGDHSDVAYLIESGRMEIVKEEGSAIVLLTTLEKGAILGEMGLVDEKPRSASARAAADTELTIIHRNEFVELLLSDPKRSILFVRALFERLRHMNSLINADIHERLVNNVAPDQRVAMLIPLTERAAVEIPKEGLSLHKFPFRIGRRSIGPERSALDMNDLVLSDTAPFNISKNHISIDYDGVNYTLSDRGSYFGTMVNGQRIGGQRLTGKAPLVLGDNEFVMGNNESLFRFRLLIQ